MPVARGRGGDHESLQRTIGSLYMRRSEMPRYETLFILHPDLPEAQVRETLDRVRRLIEGMQGQVADLNDWGMRELAYPIEKQARGIYVLVQYSAPPEVVKELERTM